MTGCRLWPTIHSSLPRPHHTPAAFPDMTDIPVLETNRLILRGFQPGDLAAMTAMWALPETVRYIGGVPLTREQSWTRLLRHIGMWSVMGFGFWVITDKATGRLIGEAGFHEMRREMSPSIEDTLEAGWGLLPEMHGKGYASETLQAMWGWAETNYPGMPITCIIDPRNEASLNLAVRHGFHETARTTYQNSEIVVLRKDVT